MYEGLTIVCAVQLGGCGEVNIDTEAFALKSNAQTTVDFAIPHVQTFSKSQILTLSTTPRLAFPDLSSTCTGSELWFTLYVKTQLSLPTGTWYLIPGTLEHCGQTPAMTGFS
jgi:hypothetical protein